MMIPNDDYRMADFKLLLPTGPEVRVLTGASVSEAFLAHLAPDVGYVDVWCEDPGMVDDVTTLARNIRGVSRDSTLAQHYSLVINDTAELDAALAPGGVLCRVAPKGRMTSALREEFEPLGAWQTQPEWPEFRFLFPRGPAGVRMSREEFQQTVKHDAPALHLFRKSGGTPVLTFREQLANALTHANPAWTDWPASQWSLYSGQRGEGNPILFFIGDAEGSCELLVKVPRYRGLGYLTEERGHIAQIMSTLGPELGRRVIAPLDSLHLGGRDLLVYGYEPTAPFFGLRWRLFGKSNYLNGLTQWLAGVARQSAHVLSRSAFSDQHLGPLERLRDRKLLPDPLQAECDRALDQLAGFREQPFSVLEHGDLGLYNTRLTRPDGTDFRVLDWGSSCLDGAPLGDLCFALNVSNAPVRLARRLVADYLEATGLAMSDAYAVWLSYMARRWEELDSIRPVDPCDPTSGGGVLLPYAQRVREYVSV